MHDLAADIWTPKEVGEELVQAVRWASRATGRIGPAGFRSGMPSLALIANDRDFEGWPPITDLEAQPMRLSVPPKRVSQYERVLWWQAKYLPDEPGSARVLKVWVRSKLTKRMTFEKACELVGWSRATAYRGRDRALGTIAVGLTAEGIIPGNH